MKTIFVTGGTGNNGKPILETLAQTDFPVKALLRDPSKAVVQAANIRYIQGDMDDAASLEKALENVHTAFLVTAYSESFPLQHKRFIEASKKVGVKHIVQLSGIGADPKAEILTAKWLGEAEQHLMSSGLSWTILRAGSFTNNFFANAGSIAKEGIIAAPYGPSGEAALSIIDNRDIGAVAAKILTEAEDHKGKIYHLTGNTHLNYKQIAGLFTKVLNKTITYQSVTDSDAKNELLQWQVPELVADSLVELWASIRNSKTPPPITDDVERILGRKPKTFEQFIRDHSKTFS